MRIVLATGLTILLIGAMPSSAADGHDLRLGKGFSWGRCLLMVGGKTLISGPCGYEIRRGGDFTINVPRQIYDGIHYPDASDCGACVQSRDYWAVVYRDDDGSWTGYGNSDIRATHGGTSYRALTRTGACYWGETDAGQMRDGYVYPEPVRICLWRR